MARAVPGGPTDEGRASYRVSLSVCSECDVRPSAAVAPELRDIDGSRQTAPVRAHTGARAKQTIPPALRRAILQRDHHRCGVPGCKSSTFLDVHHIQPRCEGGSNDPAPTPLESETKVASALRHLGFSDTGVREILAELRDAAATADDGTPRAMTTEQLLREALFRLGSKRSARR